MQSIFLIALAISATFAASLCEGPCENSLTATTLNTHLDEDSTERFQRSLGLYQQLMNDNETDLFCFQEIGNPILRRALLSSLPERFAHSYYGEEVECTEGCVISELESVMECVNASNCSMDNFACVYESCGELLLGLEETCQVCIGGYANSLEETFSLCQRNETANTTSTCVFTEVSNVIVSSYPITESAFLSFNDSRRGVLFAQSQLPSQGIVNTFCAHLSMGEEAEAQVNETLSFVEQNIASSEVVFLIGDFGFGPQLANPNVTMDNSTMAMENSTYSLFLESIGNYSNLYYQFSSEPLCTSCPENSLNEVEEGLLLDHILIRESELECVVEVSRVFTELTVNGTTGEMIPVSGQYGVSVTVCPSLPQVNSTSPSVTDEEGTQTFQPTVDEVPESSVDSLRISSVVVVLSLCLSAFFW